MDARLPARNRKSEFQLVLEFIGYRNLIILGLIGSFYFGSGVKNFLDGQPISRSFNPYYALHFHDGGRLAESFYDAAVAWMGRKIQESKDYLNNQWDKFQVHFQTRIAPFLHTHPLLGFLLIIGVGFVITIVLFSLALFIVRKTISLIPSSYTSPLLPNRGEREEEIWSFDPQKKPTDEQMKKTIRNLEKHVHLAPALGGIVPDGADKSIRDIAKKNHGVDLNYRCAIYVMGPIKGMKLDNSYDIPLALDQIKKIAQIMGRAASYETLPMDMVILRTRKGKTKWELEPRSSAINLGKSYPVKAIEQVMTKNRKYFIWDARAKKSNTGYGGAVQKVSEPEASAAQTAEVGAAEKNA
ncbi:MAG: hypothetical protein AB1656_15710 [Candidatus Omnitrophota bacterium]